MITYIEVPYIIALFYPWLNPLWWFPKKQLQIEREIKHESEPFEGVEVYIYEIKQDAPIFVNVNNVIVPIDNGRSHQESKLILSKQNSLMSKKEYFNYFQINDEDDKKASFTSKTYINTQEDFVNTFKKYKIPINSQIITLPLKIKNYNYKNGLYLHDIGLVASNKERLINDVLFKKRLPLSLTIGGLAVTGLAFSWFYYSMFNSYKTYYPPFHPERLKKYKLF